MDDVLASTGGSKRTLYKYFPGKEALFSALIARVADKTLPALDLDPTHDLHSALVDFGMRYVGTLLTRDGLALYRAGVAEAVHIPQLAAAFYDSGPGRIKALLADFLRRSKTQAGKRVKDPDAAAGLFLGLLRGDLHLAALIGTRTPSATEVGEAVQGAVRIFLAGAF